jgi:hypothetical protein
METFAALTGPDAAEAALASASAAVVTAVAATAAAVGFSFSSPVLPRLVDGISFAVSSVDLLGLLLAVRLNYFVAAAVYVVWVCVCVCVKVKSLNSSLAAEAVIPPGNFTV